MTIISSIEKALKPKWTEHADKTAAEIIAYKLDVDGYMIIRRETMTELLRLMNRDMFLAVYERIKYLLDKGEQL